MLVLNTLLRYFYIYRCYTIGILISVNSNRVITSYIANKLDKIVFILLFSYFEVCTAFVPRPRFAKTANLKFQKGNLTIVFESSGEVHSNVCVQLSTSQLYCIRGEENTTYLCHAKRACIF